LRGPATNVDIFKEPMSTDGAVKDVQKAAGLEHQTNKHADNVIFDKKAVF